MRDIFETYSISELRKFASGYNKNVKIAGASNMKKPNLIDALMKHTQFFKDVKKKVVVVKPARKPTTKAPEPKPQPKPTPKSTPKPQPKPQPKAPEPKPQPKSTPKTAEPKPQSKSTGPTMNDFINEYDTAVNHIILMQYDIKTYNNIDKFLRRIIKKKGNVDLDQFLASGVYLSNELIKKIILKYGIKKTFEYTEDLLKNIVSDEDLKIIVAPEALTNINKNRTATKIFKGNLKNVKF